MKICPIIKAKNILWITEIKILFIVLRTKLIQLCPITLGIIQDNGNKNIFLLLSTKLKQICPIMLGII